MAINLDKMSLADLKALAKDVDKAIKGFEKKKRAEALKAMEKVAKEYGLTVDEVVTGAPKRKSGSAGKAKYKNPANPKQTWTGKGRQPGWYKDAIAAGKSPDDMAI